MAQLSDAIAKKMREDDVRATYADIMMGSMKTYYKIDFYQISANALNFQETRVDQLVRLGVWLV